MSENKFSNRNKSALDEYLNDHKTEIDKLFPFDDSIVEEIKESEEVEDDVVYCNVCHAPMVLRVAKQGEFAGQEFYGCSNFPVCRNIKRIKK